MSETKLEKARAYEEAAGSKVPADLRPRYHLSSRCGWMNDPNGFSFYGGKYHMFYQYYPYDNKWGPMHWAHAESTDLLHWEYLPVILAPEEDYDGFGLCFGTLFAKNFTGELFRSSPGISAANWTEPCQKEPCESFVGR